MENALQTLGISGLAAGTLLLAVLIGNFFKRKIYSILLLVLVLLIVLVAFAELLIFNQVSDKAEIILFSGPALIYLLFPSFYLHARSLTNYQSQLKVNDSIHLAPASFYLIDNLPYFLNSNSRELNIPLNESTVFHNEVFSGKYSFFSFEHFHYYCIGFLGLVYLALQFKLIWIFLHDKKPYYHKILYKRWIIILTISFLILYLSSFLNYIVGPENSSRLSFVFLYSVIIVMSVYIFSTPEILYGNVSSPGNSLKNSNKNFLHPISPPDEENNSGQDRNHVQIGKAISMVMNEKKSFLQPKYSLPNFSEETKIPVHQLSAYLNQYLHTTFNDFINRYRIDYVKMILIQSSDVKNLRLKLIAEKAGFGNRTTFITAFKKFTGTTPSEFIKAHKDLLTGENR